MFIEIIRKSKLPHPTQRSFTIDRWEKVYRDCESTASIDVNIYNSGKWIYKQLNGIRASQNKIQWGNCNSDQLIKYFCGYINRDCQIIMQKKAPIFDGDIFISESAIQTKTPENIFQPNAHPDEILAGLIDGGRYSLIYAKSFKKSNHEVLSDEDILSRVLQTMLLGQLYDNAENLWMTCLWLSRYIKQQNETDVIQYEDNEFAINKAVTDYRRQALSLQATGHLVRIWKHNLTEIRKREIATRFQVKIAGSGKKRAFILKPIEYDPSTIPTTVLFRLLAQETYFDELINLSLPNYHNLTLEQLLIAWEILYSLVSELYKKFPEDSEVKKVSKLTQYAPSIKIKHISSLVSKALHIKHDIANFIIELFMFKFNPRCELWFHPFIELSNERVVPLIAPAMIPNLTRNIEFWLKDGGVNFSEKGKLFEEKIREEFREAIKSSNILKNVSVYHMSHKEFEEEIDIVIRLNNTLLIGEMKCHIFPVEPLDFHNYFATLKDAIVQIRRKEDAVKGNIDTFIKLIRLEKELTVDKITVIPFVFSNQPFGVGFPIENIAIVDRYILFRYFDAGFHERFVTFDQDGNKSVGDKQYFYESEHEAENNIANYLLNPPQIEMLRKHVTIKNYPFPLFDSNLKNANYLNYEVELPIPTDKKKVNNI
ncbi:MAG: hypothetical protein ACXABO_21640 [Promethearchaeota archaeon]|jgi:hypothetical protein